MSDTSNLLALLAEARTERDEAKRHATRHLTLECEVRIELETRDRERDDARQVANWLHARLYDACTRGWRPAKDGSDLPKRDWLSFDHEPERCP
jgi:hypothetical protein